MAAVVRALSVVFIAVAGAEVVVVVERRVVVIAATAPPPPPGVVELAVSVVVVVAVDGGGTIPSAAVMFAVARFFVAALPIVSIDTTVGFWRGTKVSTTPTGPFKSTSDTGQVSSSGCIE